MLGWSVGGGSYVSGCAMCADTGTPACTSHLRHVKTHPCPPPRTLPSPTLCPLPSSITLTPRTPIYHLPTLPLAG